MTERLANHNMDHKCVIGVILMVIILAGCESERACTQQIKTPKLGQREVTDSDKRRDRVLELVYPLSINEMRDILGKEDEMDPFYNPKTAQPLDLLQKAGVPMKAVETQYAVDFGTIIIIAPEQTHTLIKKLLKVEPYSNIPS